MNNRQAYGGWGPPKKSQNQLSSVLVPSPELGRSDQIGRETFRTPSSRSSITWRRRGTRWASKPWWPSGRSALEKVGHNSLWRTELWALWVFWVRLGFLTISGVSKVRNWGVPLNYPFGGDFDSGGIVWASVSLLRPARGLFAGTAKGNHVFCFFFERASSFTRQPCLFRPPPQC